MVNTGRVTATTTSGLVYTAVGRTRLTVRNENGNNVIYVGPSGVTPSTGYGLRGTEPTTVDLADGDELHAITGTGTDPVLFIATT